MVGLTLGTGVGGVIAIDGRVHLGHDGTAGEVGDHKRSTRTGRPATAATTGASRRSHGRIASPTPAGCRTAEEAVERAEAGDETAIAGLGRVGRYLGIGIANLITLVSPDRVVIGGGIAAAGDMLLSSVRAEIGVMSHDDVAGPCTHRIRLSSEPGLGRSAPQCTGPRPPNAGRRSSQGRRRRGWRGPRRGQPGDRNGIRSAPSADRACAPRADPGRRPGTACRPTRISSPSSESAE